MYKKQLSEKIAQVFVIADVLFLGPGVLGMIPAVLIMLFGILSGQVAFFLFALIPVLIFGTGMVLFVGYLRHANGNLGEDKILPLWFGTLIYNGLPLFVTWLLLIVREDYKALLIEKSGIQNFGVILIAIICWLILATCLSLTALYDEFIHSKT